MLFGAPFGCTLSGVSCSGALLCAGLFPSAFCGAVVLGCCVVRCVMVPYCLVLCPVVVCCLVVLCCQALLSFLPCCLWLFPFAFKAHCCFSLPFKIFLKNEKFNCFLLCSPASPCSVMRCCAVLPCLAALLCCVMPGGGVLCGPYALVFLPSLLACTKRHCHVLNYLPLCEPASFSVPTCMLALVMLVVATLLMLILVLVVVDFESWTGYHVIGACSEMEAAASRLEHKSEGKAPGE